MEEVVGQFDWIVDFQYLREYFAETFTGISDYNSASVLVVGCGTSTLSSDIMANMQVNSLLSVDNDAKCVSYMREKYHLDPRMKWEVFDMIEDALSGSCHAMQEGSFDLVVDKGSLDAMLVEGSIACMLLEVFRVLKEGGVYFICSLHAPALLRELLQSTPLEYEVSFPALGATSEEELTSMDGRCQTVAICRKAAGSHRAITVEEMAETEQRITDQFYQSSCPFLTEERRASIEDFFSLQGSGQPVSLELFHGFAFVDDILLGYTYELFLEDMADFPLSSAGLITLNEAIIFLTLKQ